MSDIKVAISLSFYITSCVGLLITSMQMPMLLAAYSADFIESHGPHVPAFSRHALSVMPHTEVVCVSVLFVSLLLVFLTFRKVKEPVTRLYWVGVLANINFYTVMCLYGLVLTGFFLLPKLANSV